MKLLARPGPRRLGTTSGRPRQGWPTRAAMSSSKLDAKHERTLRTLLKQPDNRRCAVCETLVRARPLRSRTPRPTRALRPRPSARAQGPQYVVINFSIFVCTNCSGVQCARAGAGLSLPVPAARCPI